jgi:uracil-DNA glycosylase
MYQLRELEELSWYLEAGVDEAIAETTRNYFEVPTVIIPNLKAQPALNPQVVNKPFVQTQSVIITEPKINTETLAKSANTLEELYNIIQNFDGCLLKKTARNTVIADGVKNAKIMIIGDMPSEDDDKSGKPFSGETGQLLDKMFAAIGLKREELYLTNILFWRTPIGRTPNLQEINICKPFVEQHIALINPAMLILTGEVAAKTIMNTKDGIMKLRGQHHLYKNSFNNVEYKTAIIYHPSYLLRQPTAKRIAWQDLQEIQRKLQNEGLKNDAI